MRGYSLVLSDELLSIYFNFKQGIVNDNRLLEKFLGYYHPPHLTNVDQLKRIGIADTSILQQLAAQGYISQNLEELVKLTSYKLLLNTENSENPYVNINHDSVEKNFSLTFRVGENRDKAIHLISALCENASFILIFDKYFCNNWNHTQEFFRQIVPKRRLTLLHDRHLSNKSGDIKQICSDWIIRQDRHYTFTNSHDRYLLIDGKVEVILSSGFRNLFVTDTDLTCLIRMKQ